MLFRSLGLFLEEDLVVLAEGGAEDDGGDALEAVYPLFALGALPADVEHVDPACVSQTKIGEGKGGHVRELAHVEARLGDADALLARAQDVGLVGEVPGRADAQDLREEAACAVSHYTKESKRGGKTH